MRLYWWVSLLMMLVVSPAFSQADTAKAENLRNCLTGIGTCNDSLLSWPIALYALHDR